MLVDESLRVRASGEVVVLALKRSCLAQDSGFDIFRVHFGLEVVDRRL